MTAGGGTDYVVDIKDEEFLDKIKNGLRISINDVFRVYMHTVLQWEGAGSFARSAR